MWFNEPKDRYRIGETSPSLLFKTLYPDFKTFQKMLKDFGVKDKWILEADFNIMEATLHSFKLKYRSRAKNVANLVFLMESFWPEREYNENILSMKEDDLVRGGNTNEVINYTVNRVEETGITSYDNYVDNRQTQKSSVKAGSKDKIDLMLLKSSIGNPRMTFLQNVMSRMVITSIIPKERLEREFNR